MFRLDTKLTYIRAKSRGMSEEHTNNLTQVITDEEMRKGVIHDYLYAQTKNKRHRVKIEFVLVNLTPND